MPDPPIDPPPPDPRAVSATSAFLGVTQTAVSPDGKLVVTLDSLAIVKR